MRTKPPLFLRGRIWWCYVRPVSGRGRRKPKTTRTRDHAAAVEVWRRLERDAVSPTHHATDGTPLHVALTTRYNERRSAGRAEGTLSMYLVKGRQLTRVLGGMTPLEHITAEAVDGYVATRLKEKARRTTIARELTTLRGALRLAKRHGKYHKDLAEVMPEFSPQYKPKTRALSEKEIRRLLAHLAPKRAAIIAFLLATGATYPSELEKITRADISMRSWTVHLPGTKRETRDRVVPIVSFARPWLQLAMKSFPFERWGNVRRDMLRACEAARIAPCSPNDLRRSVATLMRARGVEPSLLGLFLGHADSRMAERVYGRLAPGQLAHLLDQRLRATTRAQHRA